MCIAPSPALGILPLCDLSAKNRAVYDDQVLCIILSALP